MCGLVSIVSKSRNGFHKDQTDAFKDLLFIDQLRGGDSTGMFLVTQNGELELAKEASHATNFLMKKEPNALLAKAFQEGSALVGHNRAATKGTIVDENAHPFVVDDRITLVHNGTLWGDHTKLAKTEVDSHAIAHVIHSHGDDVEAALKEINGAFALIWHDFKNRTLNFIRNSQRPLHWVETTQGWIWASEANMIEWILARHSMKAMDKVSSLPENCLCYYTQENGGWSINTKQLNLSKVHTYTGGSYYTGWKDRNYNPYNTVSDDDEYDLLKKQLEVEEEKTKYTSQTTSHPVTYLMQENLRKREQHLASSINCHMTWNKWNQVSSPYQSGETHVMDCFDFFSVNEHSPNAGYYLYGTLESEPDMMIKVHIPMSTEGETKLLDWTINKRKCTIQLGVKSWNLYSDQTLSDGQAGDGWGIWVGNSVKELTILESA